MENNRNMIKFGSLKLINEDQSENSNPNSPENISQSSRGESSNYFKIKIEEAEIEEENKSNIKTGKISKSSEEFSNEERFDKEDNLLKTKFEKKIKSKYIGVGRTPVKNFKTNVPVNILRSMEKRSKTRLKKRQQQRSKSVKPDSRTIEEILSQVRKFAANSLKNSQDIFEDNATLTNRLKTISNPVLQSIITNALKTDTYKKYIQNEKMLSSLETFANASSEREIHTNNLSTSRPLLLRFSSKQGKQNSIEFDCGYFSIAVFLSSVECDKAFFGKLLDFLKVSHRGLKETYKSMVSYEKNEKIEYSKANYKPKKIHRTLNALLTRLPFMLHLVKSLLCYGEKHVYRHFLDYLIDNKLSWKYLINEKIIRKFFEYNKIKELKVLIKLFLISLHHGNEIAKREFLSMGVGLEKKIKEQTSGFPLLSSNRRISNSKISPFQLRSKSERKLNEDSEEEKAQRMEFDDILDIIVKNLIEISSIFKREEEVIGYILDFSTPDLDHHRIFKLILSLSNEEILYNFTKKNENYLYDKINKTELVDNRMFKVLVLFSPFEIAKCLEVDNNFRKILDFEVKPETADEINSITMLFTKVKKSFWNIKRFWQFFQQVCEFLEFDVSKSPFVFCPNPLLLAIRLYNLLKNFNLRLNINAKEIITVWQELEKFLVEMIEITDHRELRVYIIEQDLIGNNFLDYIFKANSSEISRQNYIHQIIDNMWDQRRLSKHGILDFLMMHEMEMKSIQKFWDIFKLKPVQDVAYSSSFMYTFTSTSVFLRVVLTVFTNIFMACIEFWFTMMASKFYDDKSSWGVLSESYEYAPKTTKIFFLMRIFYLINLVTKMLTLKIKIRSLNIVDSSILFSYILQICVFPWLNSYDIRHQLEYFWIQFQVLIFILLVVKAGMLSLSIPWMGVQLRIGMRMFFTVLAFTVASFIIILVLAFIFFTWFRDYDQPGGANRFFSIYNGILILFEFLFGSVLYLREEPINFYSVGQNVILITFSYLGNIMMANILIAFLTNQYEIISKHASYHTKKMQYILLVAYKSNTFDSIYMMPIFINFLYFLILPLMAFKKLRPCLNEFMKKIAHTFLVAVPATILISLFSLAMTPFLYLKLLKNFLLNFCSRPKQFFLFLFLGIFTVIFLWIKDTCMLCKLLFSYKKVNVERFWNQKLSPDTIEIYEKCYSSFKAICKKLLNEKKTKVSINELIYHHKFETSRRKSLNSVMMFEMENLQKIIQRSKNKKNYLMETKDNKNTLELDERKIFLEICKQFLSISEINGCRSLMNSTINLGLSLKILEIKQNSCPTINLISFVLFEVQSSRIAATFDEDADLKGEIKYLQAEITEVKDMVKKIVRKIELD